MNGSEAQKSLRQPGDPLEGIQRAHGFASPPYDGFALLEDDKVTQLLGKLELGEPLLNISLVKKP
jgi:hypothetical protein